MILNTKWKKTGYVVSKVLTYIRGISEIIVQFLLNSTPYFTLLRFFTNSSPIFSLSILIMSLDTGVGSTDGAVHGP